MKFPRNIGNPFLEVDKDFCIEVESQSWNVWHNRDVEKVNKETRKKTGEMGKKWTEIAYCRDLPAALRAIMRQKTASDFKLGTLRDYLAWEESNLHSMLDRVLRCEAELKKAIEKNGVMVSYHNFE